MKKTNLFDEKADQINSVNNDLEVDIVEPAKMTKKENIIQMLKFVMFSIGAGLIQMTSFTLLTEVFLIDIYWLSYLISLVLSVVFNFTINRKFTFKSANNVPKAMFFAFLFYVPFAPYTTYLTAYLTDSIFWNEYLVVFIMMVQNLILEYLWSRFVTFRNSINTNSLAKKVK